MPLPASLTLALLDQLPEAIAVIDARQQGLPLVLANGVLVQLLGKERDAIVSGGLVGLIGETEAKARRVELEAHMARAESFSVRATVGTGTVVEVRFEPMRDEAGAVTHYVCFHERIAEPAAAEPAPIVRAPLQRDDRLTGLRHAEYFHEILRRDFAIAQREAKALTLFVVDIDALGGYNVTFGRQAGDSAIRRVGRALSGALRRASDLLARVDGGQFLALSSGMDLAQARQHGELLAARVRELHMHHPHSPVARVLTVSVGVAHLVPEPAATPELLLHTGQLALDSARTAGRNRVAALEPARR